MGLTFDMSGGPKGAKRPWNVRSMEGLGVAVRTGLIAMSSAEGRKAWVEGDFPQMTVGVLEIARVASVERCVAYLDDSCARLSRLLHCGDDLLFRFDVAASRRATAWNEGLGGIGAGVDVGKTKVQKG